MKRPAAGRASAHTSSARTSPAPDRGVSPLIPGYHALLDPRGPFLVPILLLLATRALAWYWLPHASEDAYITFRYARNLATSHQLVFNPGERVMGFTSPLWTLWSTLGYALTQDPATWTRLTSIVGDLGTLLLLGVMIEQRVSRASAWCFTFFFAGWPYFSMVTLSGMENSFLLFLIVLGAALGGRRSPAAGPVLAAAALTRPEGLLAALGLFPGLRARDRIVALVLIAAGIGALTAYFGSAIPQSLIAKSRLYGTPGPWTGRFWWNWILPAPIGGFGAFSGEGRQLVTMSVLFLPALILGTPVLWRERNSPLARAVGVMLAVWLAYAALGVAYFFWYLVIPLTGLAVVASIGLPRLARGRILYASCVVLVLGSWTPAYSLYVGRAQNEFYGFANTGKFLAANAEPGQSVMLEPIGIVGYNVPVRIIDEVGLVSPEVAKRRLEGPGWYTDIVEKAHPDWLVIRRGTLQSGVSFAGAGAPFRSPGERDELLRRYEVATVVDTLSGDNALVVLHRLGAAVQGRSR
jgi:arabinofuranosyltransferase